MYINISKLSNVHILNKRCKKHTQQMSKVYFNSNREYFRHIMYCNVYRPAVSSTSVLHQYKWIHSMIVNYFNNFVKVTLKWWESSASLCLSLQSKWHIWGVWTVCKCQNKIHKEVFEQLIMQSYSRAGNESNKSS